MKKTITDVANELENQPLITAEEISQFKYKVSEHDEDEDPIEKAKFLKEESKDAGAGGIHTNDETCVKQYFDYYAKLVN
jgi:hypothetical protein